MKVRYIYSACIEIETQDVRILTDPWFTDGAYDGSWYQFPRLENPLDILREPDVIYISHIHPDHYDPAFLRQLFNRFGWKPVLIPDHANNYLLFKARRDGIDVTPTTHRRFGNTNLHIVPNVVPSGSDIDSALIVNAGRRTVLNLNDCLWNDPHVARLQEIVAGYTAEIDLLALGYTGAGPYPQTYFDPVAEKTALMREAARKKEIFFDRYRQYCRAFPAKKHLPFAGKYILGGKLAKLNPFRGVADTVEVLAFDKRAVVLADGGSGEIDLDTMESTAVRTETYPEADLQRRIDEIKALPLDYETEIQVPFAKLDFNRLLRTAYSNAQRKSEVRDDYWFVFHIEHDDSIRESYEFNARRGATEFTRLTAPEQAMKEPRSECFVDYRHLYGCLTTAYHWNNSEIGSFMQVRRTPNEFNRDAQRFLNFLSCA